MAGSFLSSSTARDLYRVTRKMLYEVAKYKNINRQEKTFKGTGESKVLATKLGPFREET